MHSPADAAASACTGTVRASISAMKTRAQPTMAENSICRVDDGRTFPHGKVKPRMRRALLSTHIVCSVGWFGAVLSFLALAIAALKTADSGSS